MKRRCLGSSWSVRNRQPLDEILEPFNSEDSMKTWLQSRTIQGLLASGVALVLGLFVADGDAAGLVERVSAWLLEGVQIGGLLWAARGRKLAQGPLA